MNKMSYEEHIEALKEIKNGCERREKCTRCPFYCKDFNMCILHGITPCGWLLDFLQPKKGNKGGKQ